MTVRVRNRISVVFLSYPCRCVSRAIFLKANPVSRTGRGIHLKLPVAVLVCDLN